MKLEPFCVIIAGLLAILPNAVAQAPASPLVDEVELQGLSTVSEQLVRSQLEIRPGHPFTRQAVARDLRRLGGMGFFTTISAEREIRDGRLVVIYIFHEERIVDAIEIIGADKVKTRDIRSAISWRENSAFVQETYQEERDAVLAVYAEKGFLNASVDIVVEEVSSSRVHISYIIDEGKKSRIRDLRFEGNSVLSDRKLRKKMKTKKKRLFLGGRYDADEFEEDLKGMLRKYGDVGYLEAEILPPKFEYSPNGKKLEITIFIREGSEYRVGTLEIMDNFVFTDAELLELIEVGVGDVHNESQVEVDRGAIQLNYMDNGYVDADVELFRTLDREAKTTRIVYSVNEEDLQYIKEIKITGNEVTKDDVVRRSLVVNPGERFDGSKLQLSRNRLRATRYYASDPTITIEPVDDGTDRFKNLLIDVDEGDTGNFNFGAGFSSEEGVLGFTELRLSNFDITNWPSFTGAGQQFTARAEIGRQRTRFNVGFTDPEIFGYPLSFGVDFFDQSFETRGGSSFTQDSRGGGIRFGKNLSPYVNARAAFRFREDEISGLAFFLSPELEELRNPGSVLSTVWGITRNKVDDFLNPNKGARHDISLELAGFGGDNEFVKLQHDSKWYVPLDKDKNWVFSYRTREGWALPYGSSDLVPLGNRFFVGGATTIRGYDVREVGPRARTFSVVNNQLVPRDIQAIGGELRFINNLEVRRNVNEILRLYTFLDYGGAWATADQFDAEDVRFGVGVGVGLQLPVFGPVRIDWGFPINPDDDQGSSPRIHLNAGFGFR